MVCRTGWPKKPRTMWEEKRVSSAAKDPKVPKKAARTVGITVLKSIATGPLPEDAGLEQTTA